MGKLTVLAVVLGLAVSAIAQAGPPGHVSSGNNFAPNPPGRALGLRDQAPGQLADHDGHAFGRNGFHPWWRNLSTSVNTSTPPGHAFAEQGDRPWWKKLFGGR